MCCIRCEDQSSLTPHGYCADCLAVVHTEVEFGFFRLGEYLERWAEFAAWCDARGLVAC